MAEFDTEPARTGDRRGVVPASDSPTGVGDAALRRTPRVARVAWAALPLFAFVLARSVLAAGAASAGYDPWAKSSWCRGDSGHYLEIAMRGYRLFPCPESQGEWCGNTSWFPAYPGVVRVVRGLGVPVRPAALWVSAAFALSTLFLVWGAGLSRAARGSGVAALLLAALFPGIVYHHAAFPLSMFAFFTVACLIATAARRPVAAGLAGGVAAATYTPGVLLAPVVGLAFLAASDRPWPGRLGRAVLAGALVSLGLAATLVIQRLSVGTWRALALGHAGYGYTLTDPFTALARHVHTLWASGSPFRWPADTGAVLAFHSLLTAAVVISIVVATARGSARSPLAAPVSLYLLAFWLFPILITEEPGDLPRRESMLLPAVLLAPALPRPWLWTLAFFALAVAAPVARLFVASRLI